MALSSPRAALLLRGLLGALCALALVVVASAVFRMHVYEQAYGFTRTRLLVTVFEGWLGLVLVLVLAAGVRLRGGWVARAALLTGATSVLLLAVINPDAYIARHNLERAGAVRLDAPYLVTLSADAVPTLAAGGVDLSCMRAAAPSNDDWLEWNLGRDLSDRVAVHRGGHCAFWP